MIYLKKIYNEFISAFSTFSPKVHSSITCNYFIYENKSLIISVTVKQAGEFNRQYSNKV